MPDPADPVPEPHPTSRRTVLRVAGLAALTGGGAAALGACTSTGEVGAPASSASAPSASSAPPSSPAASPSSPAASPSSRAASPSASASASASASTSAPVPAGPSVAASEVPVGGGVILEDADFVVTQPTRGDFKAFSKTCTHQRCPVTSVTDGTINCPCHNSKFSITDGSVQAGPANRPLPAAELEVAGNRVVITS